LRRADIEASGQGAPLVPGFHKSVLADGNEDRMVLNIGGIADITIQPADPSRAVTGFDTGHGNTVVDQWAHRYQGTVMDVDGKPGWARQTITCCNSCLRSLVRQTNTQEHRPRTLQPVMADGDVGYTRPQCR
jgi:1,6-anhydro-N-acetylmuramate kinase